MNTSLTAPILALPGWQHHPQGSLASPFLGLALYFIAALSIAIFVIRLMRRRHQPPRSFAAEWVLAFIPIFCATVHLIPRIQGIQKVRSRVEFSHFILKNQLNYALRPLHMALIASSLMVLIILLMWTLINRKKNKVSNTPNEQGTGVS